MWRALLLVCAALLVSAVDLLYFSLPGAFLMQLGFSNCLRTSPWHLFWTLAAWTTPLLAPLLLWLASRSLKENPRHPIFGLHILVVFCCGLLMASGFFAMRLLWRLDSPLLQASLFVGYCLALDLCADAASWRRLPRPVWIFLCFCVAISAAYTMQRFAPTVRETDLGEMRVRLVGRTVFRRSVPVCLSPAALSNVSWRFEELKRRDLRQACVAWPFAFDLPQVFRHCVSQPIPVPANPAEQEWREESTLVNGDPAVGTVLFLGQVHHREDDTPQQRWSVVESQLHIYDELLRHPAWPVFNEGTCVGNLGPNRALAGQARARSAVYARKFSASGQWSPAYTRVLFASLGAVGALDEVGDLESFATSRCEDPQLLELDRLEAQLEMTAPDAPQYESLLTRMNAIRMDYRELEAIRQIHDYLAVLPGSSVLLVYGEAHQFAEPLWRQVFGARLPRVSALRWSIPVSASWDLEALDAPGERLQWIRTAPAFPVSALSLLRNRDELFAMLPKLLPESLRDAGPVAARERLIALLNELPFSLTDADHLRVSEWLWRSYSAAIGPFRGYQFAPGWAASFRRLEPAAQSAALGDFTEPYLQRRALQLVPRLRLEHYPDLMMPEARAEALEKLEVPPVLSAEEVKNFLDAANTLIVDQGGKLAALVNRKWTWPLSPRSAPRPAPKSRKVKSVSLKKNVDG